jgi:hypothetical protein
VGKGKEKDLYLAEEQEQFRLLDLDKEAPDHHQTVVD